MDNFLNPSKILKNLDLRDNMVAVDFGCGTGGWAIPLAKRLEEGKVYALDIQEEMLSALKSHAQLEKIYNIETRICDLERENGSGLPENSLDLALLTNILFQLEDKKIVLQEIKRILKKQGKLLIVDWNADASFGPKEGRISAEEISRIAKEIDFKLEKEFDASAHHYGLIFTKE
ncbi:class I SAM-dependent methyltransferase [Candidatus Parcubacteria bacterium]|nr:class I SAM-dependent methyltransferase [Candidatus Parcubacteria bacterium]